MERHKRVDSWLVAILLVVLLFRALWNNDLLLSLIAFVLLFVLPFIFPKPKEKPKFIDEFIEWEIAWVQMPPYSKIVDWLIEGAGFVLACYGAWQHSWLLVSLGSFVAMIGLADFLIRFGYRRAFEKR